jgi:phosphoribosylformimino-5-aminoimidazole carboxamide ribotide isomerase
VAQRFRQAGAAWLHVIDLEGARNGRVSNIRALRDTVKQTGVRVQFGGGIRDEPSIQAALEAGAERVIVGTRALEDWDWFQMVVHKPDYAGRIALGLDARLGKLAVHAWTKQTERVATDVAKAVEGWPLATIVYTDIGRDGLLLGPNIKAIELLASVSSVPVIASGGVSDVEDVRRLAQVKLAGVVIGRAIYEGAIELKEALAVGRPTAS